MEEPLFSIITITFNAEKELPPTLDSVSRQTFHGFEYMIIDGKSSDNTVKIAQGSGIRMTMISEPDKGLYDAMNKGMRKAKGKYLIFLNAGDAFHSPETLSEIATTAEANGYPDIVYGQTQLVNSSREFVGMRHLSAPKHLTFKSFSRGMAGARSGVHLYPHTAARRLQLYGRNDGGRDDRRIYIQKLYNAL